MYGGKRDEAHWRNKYKPKSLMSSYIRLFDKLLDRLTNRLIDRQTDYLIGEANLDLRDVERRGETRRNGVVKTYFK